ncbi:MAG: LysR family transcriptional regulator [Thiolinea sp.]
MAELKWLEDLLALMEEDSFTKAAKRRYVTQPAFSRRIRQLERWLDVELIDSKRKPVHILPLAREHESQIRTLIHDFYQLRNSLHHSSREQRTGFVVQHTLAVSHFPALIRHMLPALPHHYYLQTANNEECTGLFSEQSSFMLCYERPGQSLLPQNEGLERVKLDCEHLIPVIHHNQQALPDIVKTAGSDNSRPQPLPLLLFPKGGFLADVLAAGCLPATMRDYPVEIICESAFAISLKEMVLAGMGIAWLPAGLVKDEIAAKRLIALDKKLGSCELDICLYYRLSSHAETAFRLIQNTKDQNTS